MFSKPQREYLGAVSRVVYGSESQWQKRLERGEFDRTSQVAPAEGKEAYVALNNSKKQGSRGTVVSLTKARELGFVGDAAPAADIQRTRPTQFEDVAKQLETRLHLTVLYAAKMRNPVIAASVDAEERSRLLSAWLVAKDGFCPVRLTLTGPSDEAYVDTAKALITTLPERHRAMATEMLGQLNGTSIREGLSFDAIEWLSDLALCSNHAREAADLYAACVGVTPRELPQ